jgi:hypothetical protein
VHSPHRDAILRGHGFARPSTPERDRYECKARQDRPNRQNRCIPAQDETCAGAAVARAIHSRSRRCALAPMNELGGPTRPNAKPTSGPTVHHDRSAAGSSDDRPRRLAPLRRVECAIPPHPPCLAGGSAPARRRASADQLSGGRPHDALPRQAPPHCASGMNAAPPRPKRESVRLPQPWTPEGIGTGCETVLRCACTAANVGGQSNRQHRLHCMSIDPAVRNAAGCRP